MPNIKLDGMDKLQKALKDNVTMDDVKKVVRNNGKDLQKLAQFNADFHGHYGWVQGVGRVFKKPTGALKESIGLELKDGGFAAEVEPTKEYAPYVEYGTRLMEAQPYIGPSFNEQKEKFKKDMQRLVK